MDYMEFEEEIQDKEYFEEKIRCLEAKIMMLQDEVNEHKEITKQGFNNIKSACDDILNARPYVRMGIKNKKIFNPINPIPLKSKASRYDMMHAQNRAVQTAQPEFFNFSLLKSINLSDFGFSIRVLNCLKFKYIECIKDLVRLSELDLLKIPNFGPKSLKEVKEILAKNSLSLGMDIPN